MVRFSAIVVGSALVLGFVPSIVARGQAPLTINEVRVDSAAARIVVTGHDFGSGRGLKVTLGEIGDITRACSLQATSPQTVVCDFSRVGLPPAGDYRIALIAGSNPGESGTFDLTIGLPSAVAALANSLRTVEIAVGWDHACARRANGTLTCWGDDLYGESTPPTNTFRQLAAGHYFNCAVKTSRALLCWGSNNTGQVSGASSNYFTQVAAGSNHACGLEANGYVGCWGYTFAPDLVDTFTQISAGTGYTCGIRTGGTLLCWGYNAYGLSPAPAGTYTHVASGPYHSCAVRSDGTVVCWGSNGAGQVGPVPAGAYTRVAAGNDFSCAIRTDGSVVCWGYDFYGQVSGVPAGSFSQIAAKGQHACGIKTDGSVACWGYNPASTFTPPAAFP
jgi:alpha-tubulin suppressor-like RCC1 family protein